MLNGEFKNALPDSSILKKLKEVDQGSPAWIMQRAEEVQKEYSRLEGAVSPNAFAKGVDAVLGLFFRRAAKGAAKDTLRASWEYTGNNLRKAILDYCEIFPEKAAVATLTEVELQDLRRIDGDKILGRIPVPVMP